METVEYQLAFIKWLVAHPFFDNLKDRSEAQVLMIYSNTPTNVQKGFQEGFRMLTYPRKYRSFVAKSDFHYRTVILKDIVMLPKYCEEWCVDLSWLGPEFTYKKSEDNNGKDPSNKE